MVDSDLTPLRDRCPRLHEEIVAPFHDLAMRCAFEVLAAVAEAVNSCTSLRGRKRRKYILDVTSRNDDLLIPNSHPPDHYWELCEYDIEAEDRKAVPKHLLKLGTYIPPLKTHHLRFEAWVPADLATPRWALPPESLGRPYSVDELAFSFAVLHDADGGFESIVPAWHQWMDGVYGNCCAFVRVPGLDSTATDLWVAELKPLLARVREKLQSDAVSSNPTIDESLMTVQQIARHFRREDVDAVRKMLERWRKRNDNGWVEVENPKTRQCRYLYEFSAIAPLFNRD